MCVAFSTCLVECDGDQFLKMIKFCSAAAEFMAFRPSEIAASVALVALGKYDSSILESVVTCCKQLRKVLHIRHHSPQSRNAILVCWIIESRILKLLAYALISIMKFLAYALISSILRCFLICLHALIQCRRGY